MKAKRIPSGVRGELLVGAKKALFRYDGKSVKAVEGGEATGGVDSLIDVRGELLVGASKASSANN